LLGGLAKTILVLVLVGAVAVYNLGFCQRAEIEAVTMIKVFFDEAQTQELTQGATIDWGQVHSGNQTKSLWINNTGSVPAVLQFNHNGQQFPMDWKNSWDYDGSPLAAGDTVKVTITLELPENIGAGEYMWDSGISATQAT
jgi:hypothetical protein